MKLKRTWLICIRSNSCCLQETKDLDKLFITTLFIYFLVTYRLLITGYCAACLLPLWKERLMLQSPDSMLVLGNGHERDFLDDRRVYIMDMYNSHIYPRDGYAKKAIKRKVELDWGTEDSEYLQKVEHHCEGALNEIRPDIIVYNAGTDILDGDPLGGLSISPHGIVKRDELVFRAARRRDIPILMVTSGGYQKKTARIIADSILNLHHQGLIGPEAMEGEGSSSVVTSMISGPGSSSSAFTTI